MSTIKVNGIRGTGASADAITVNATDGTCTANITNNLSNRNLIINGAMQVAQRMNSSNTGGLNLDGVKTVDRFALWTGGTDNACTQHHVDVAAGTTPYTLGFRKKYQITNGDQTSGAGAADSAEVQTLLEGQDIHTSGWNPTDTNSKLTISYWAKSSVAQTFYFRFRIFASSEYEYAYSVALSANTWTKVTKTIPGNSNFSSLVNTSAKGLAHIWSLFNGTDQTNNKTLDEWAVKDNANKSPDCTSTWWTTNDATFELTGVQLEVGDTATDFEHRSYGDELQRCKRYLQKFGGNTSDTQIGNGLAHSSTVIRMQKFLNPEMRGNPTLTASGTFKSWDGGAWPDIASGEFALDKTSTTAVKIHITTSGAGHTAGRYVNVAEKPSTLAYIYLDAEL